MKNKILFVVLFCSINIFPQTGKLAGKITETVTGKPIPAANINLKEIPKGAASIGEGEYIITKIPQGKYTVNFSCRGYEMRTIDDVEIKNGETTKLEVELTPVKIKMETGKSFDPDTDLNEKIEKEYMSIIPENIKNLINEIKALDRHTYGHVLSQTYFAIKTRSSNQPQHYILRAIDQKLDYLRVIELDVRSELLGAQYRNSSDASKKKELKSKLSSVLKDLFKARQEETRIRLEIMEKEIAEAKTSLKKWLKDEDESIKKRLKYLTEGSY